MEFAEGQQSGKEWGRDPHAATENTMASGSMEAMDEAIVARIGMRSVDGWLKLRQRLRLSVVGSNPPAEPGKPASHLRRVLHSNLTV